METTKVGIREFRTDLAEYIACQVPQVMQVAIAQNDEAAVLRLGVFPRLLFGCQRVDVFSFGLQHQQRETFVIEQKEVNKAFAGRLKVIAQGIDLGMREFDVGLQSNICLAVPVIEEAPTRCFEQLVDLDSGLGFFGHSGHFRGSASPGNLPVKLASSPCQTYTISYYINSE